MLPSDPKARKATPIFTGAILYFPDVWREIAKVSVLGNQQHNPGEPLHWERGKSMDQLDAAFRHMIDNGTGNVIDTDGTYHLAKAAWRILAQLQLTIEAQAKAQTKKPRKLHLRCSQCWNSPEEVIEGSIEYKKFYGKHNIPGTVTEEETK